MKKIIYGFVITISLFLLSNCNDEDFLKENPPSMYTTENIFSSPAQVDQILIHNYRNLRRVFTANAGSWTFNLKGNGSDMYDAPTNRMSSQFNDYSKISPLHSTFSNAYSSFYRMINRANFALMAAELPQIKWGSDEEKKYIIAQAKFFRALGYRGLGIVFGGVPIITEIEDEPRYDYVRATRVETYDFAINELMEIEDDLPVIASSKARISRGAAQHYICELYLAKGIELADNGDQSAANESFSKSIEYANKLIDGGNYALINSRFGTRKTTDEVYFGNGHVLETSNVIDSVQTNYYWDLFQEGNPEHPENTESIWIVTGNYDAYKAGDTGSRLNLPRSYGGVFRANSGGHWDSNSTNEDVGGRGITSITITFYARDSIYAGKYADDMRNSQVVFRRNIKGNKPGSTYYNKYVPWEKIYNTEKDKTQCFPISCKISTDKFTGVEDGQNKSYLFRSDYLIRLSETILLRAEAKQRMGDKQGAADDINLLRDRAQCSYRVSASDVDDDFNLILDERARELIYEELRFMTLLRMGSNIAVERIKKYAFHPHPKSTLNFQYNLWPIPQEIINLNIANPMAQNPGWENK